MNETTFSNIYYFLDTSCQRIIIFEEFFIMEQFTQQLKELLQNILGELQAR